MYSVSTRFEYQMDTNIHDNAILNGFYEWGTMAYLPINHDRPQSTSPKLTHCRLV